MRELWFERDGARLFAIEDGAGPPLVMLHGGNADHRAARLSVADLAHRYRVVTPDLRGSGRSHWAGPLDWATLSGDVAGLLDALGVSRAVVGGASFGSGAAVRFALDYPDRVAGLVLNLPFFAGQDRGMTAFQREQLGGFAALARRAPTEGVQVLAPAYAALPEPMRAGALAMIASFDPASIATTAAFVASDLQPFASAGDLKRLKMPVLIQPGADPMHPAEVAALYAQSIPHAIVGSSIADFCASLPPW